jgi:hypothetical protein
MDTTEFTLTRGVNIRDQFLVLFVGIKEEGIGVMLGAMNILHHMQLHGWPTKMLR